MLWTKQQAYDLADTPAVGTTPATIAAKAFCDGRKVGVLIGAGVVGLLWAGAIAWYMAKR